jgi:hypothetical protein
VDRRIDDPACDYLEQDGTFPPALNGTGDQSRRGADPQHAMPTEQREALPRNRPQCVQRIVINRDGSQEM